MADWRHTFITQWTRVERDACRDDPDRRVDMVCPLCDGERGSDGRLGNVIDNNGTAWVALWNEHPPYGIETTRRENRDEPRHPPMYELAAGPVAELPEYLWLRCARHGGVFVTKAELEREYRKANGRRRVVRATLRGA